MPDEERRVDWDVVDDELYQIPAVYKDGRFDSLKHVLTVLGAVDSEAALEEVGTSLRVARSAPMPVALANLEASM
jgi:hypothetical protein